MTQNKHEIGSLVTQTRIINPEDGQYIENEKLLDKPEITPIKQAGRKFIKVNDRLEDINLNYLQQGYLFCLAKYIEYGTGRLTISKGVGKPPIIIRTDKLIGKLIGISRKTAFRFRKELMKYKILYIIDKQLYINPTFIQRGQYFPVDIAEIIMESDVEFKNWIPANMRKKLSVFKKSMFYLRKQIV